MTLDDFLLGISLRLNKWRVALVATGSFLLICTIVSVYLTENDIFDLKSFIFSCCILFMWCFGLFLLILMFYPSIPDSPFSPSVYTNRFHAANSFTKNYILIFLIIWFGLLFVFTIRVVSMVMIGS